MQWSKNLFFWRLQKNRNLYVKRNGRSGRRFYPAQDADSEGVEGKYYTFDVSEIEKVLEPEAAREFQSCYGISEEGNFEGKNIPNLHSSKTN